MKRPRRRVVGHVAPGGLRREPLAHVALARAGTLGEIGRGQRAGTRHRPVQAELVADEDESGMERGRDVLNDFPEKLLHLSLVERCLTRCHDYILLWAKRPRDGLRVTPRRTSTLASARDPTRRPSLPLGGGGIDHRPHQGDAVAWKAAARRVLLDQVRAGRDVDAVELVGGHVAREPLDVRPQLAEDRPRLLRGLLELLRAPVRRFPGSRARSRTSASFSSFLGAPAPRDSRARWRIRSLARM